MRMKGGSLLKSSANSPTELRRAGNIVIDKTQPGTRGASQGHTDPSVFTGERGELCGPQVGQSCLTRAQGMAMEQ